MSNCGWKKGGVKLKVNIELDGRKLTNTIVDDINPNSIESTDFYDDGTIIKYIQTSEGVNVECNKQLVLQPDGKTVKIIE